MTSPWFGAVADDITGAVDLAGEMAATGTSVAVVIGVPDAAATPPPVDAVIVALKSRTAPAAEAVEESLAAAGWLLDGGASTLYQKYCSTFDSTDAGNIGPVADALADLRDGFSVGTPATPAAGRTQYQGTLFVGDRLLSESSLAHHPLTPMTDPDLVRVLSRQTPRRVGLVHHAVVRQGTPAISAEIARLHGEGVGHVLVDAITDDDLDSLAGALDRSSLLAGALDPSSLIGGGAGVASALARAHATSARHTLPDVAPGARLILSGSGSERTRAQVAAYPGPVVTVDPLDLDPLDLEERVRAAMGERPVLVSATASPDEVLRVQGILGAAASARIIELALANLAVTAVDEWGVTELIIAGGETSGAVVAALGVGMLHLGERVAPGVSWAVATGERDNLALLLKSGNFGADDLFTTAWRAAPRSAAP